jgi:HSP20 family protein
MNLVRRTSPWFPSLLEEFFTRDFGIEHPTRTIDVPSVNIIERSEGFALDLAAPGKKREDFQVEVDNHFLTISTENQSTQESTDGDYSRREFSYDAFQRSFRLPKTVDTTKIKASYDNGLLHISIPKRKEAIPEPKKSVEIK